MKRHRFLMFGLVFALVWSSTVTVGTLFSQDIIQEDYGDPDYDFDDEDYGDPDYGYDDEDYGDPDYSFEDYGDEDYGDPDDDFDDEDYGDADEPVEVTAFEVLLYIPEKTYEGYTLMVSQDTGDAYLVDMEGNIINRWDAELGRDAFFLDNGNLIRSRERSIPVSQQWVTDVMRGNFEHESRITEMRWDNEIIWEWELNRLDMKMHHGFEVLPNGNFMVIIWEYKTLEDAVALGLNPDGLETDSIWSEAILEIDPRTQEIVWEWHVWDHLVQNFDPDLPNYGEPSEHPGRIDINYNRLLTPNDGDWLHINSVDYNPELGLLILSPREFSEVWVIDHNLTTEEAAGPAGEILYRWGNPAAYGLGDESDQMLFQQHDAQWIPASYPNAGNVVLYNNRVPTGGIDDRGRPEAYSTIVEIALPAYVDGVFVREEGQAFGPNEPAWTWQADPPTDFYGRTQSGVERLPNGNTLVTSTPERRIFEVTPDGEMVWEMTTEKIFRARRYTADHPALAGRDLSPMATP